MQPKAIAFRLIIILKVCKLKIEILGDSLVEYIEKAGNAWVLKIYA